MDSFDDAVVDPNEARLDRVALGPLDPEPEGVGEEFVIVVTQTVGDLASPSEGDGEKCKAPNGEEKNVKLGAGKTPGVWNYTPIECVAFV
jgi:hypothetical protein